MRQDGIWNPQAATDLVALSSECRWDAIRLIDGAPRELSQLDRSGPASFSCLLSLHPYLSLATNHPRCRAHQSSSPTSNPPVYGRWPRVATAELETERKKHTISTRICESARSSPSVLCRSDSPDRAHHSYPRLAATRRRRARLSSLGLSPTFAPPPHHRASPGPRHIPHMHTEDI